MRPPNSGSTMISKYSFSRNTAVYSWSSFSSAILSITGWGYTTPLLPWYTLFSRNIGFFSGFPILYVGIFTFSTQAFTLITTMIYLTTGMHLIITASLTLTVIVKSG